jgi:hypothetical protein
MVRLALIRSASSAKKLRFENPQGTAGVQPSARRMATAFRPARLTTSSSRFFSSSKKGERSEAISPLRSFQLPREIPVVPVSPRAARVAAARAWAAAAAPGAVAAVWSNSSAGRSPAGARSW